jgi:hypothetical protein
MMPLWTLDPTSTRSTATFFSLSFDTGTAFQLVPRVLCIHNIIGHSTNPLVLEIDLS